MFKTDLLLGEDRILILTALKTLKALDLIDDIMRPNLMISTKTLEQIRYEIDRYLLE